MNPLSLGHRKEVRYLNGEFKKIIIINNQNLVLRYNQRWTESLSGLRANEIFMAILFYLALLKLDLIVGGGP